MNQKLIIGVITIIIVAAGVGIYSSNSSKREMAKKSAMEQQKEKEAMIQKESDGAIEKPEGAMVKKEGAMISQGMTMKLASLGNSGVTGDVLFTPKEDKTEVSIMLKGAVKGSVYPSHIHEGSCPTPGAVKYPLTSIIDGKSITLVNISVDQLLKAPPLAINVHKSPTELKSYVACGDLKTAIVASVSGVMVKQEGAVMEKKEEGVMMAKAGSYEAYSPEKIALASSKGNVVLNFSAAWCPTCRALEANINANLANIPSNLTILKVDYDNSTDLKKKYGVTYQHTLVQVDKDGNLIKKWMGSPTLAAFVAEVK